jgi:DNA excision repair protein ERCC-2
LEEFILEEPRHVDQVIKEGRARRICAWATARSSVRDAHILVCDYNHVFIEGVMENSLPIMGVSLENTILIVDEAHNLPDRIRSGLERRVTKNVFQRALDDINEHKENLENTAKQLELSDSKSLDEAILLEKQVRALKDDSGLNNWFEGKKTEIESSQRDDLRVETSEFLDAIASAIDGVEGDELEDGISRIRRMNRRLLSVVIDEDDSIEEDEQNDCIRLAEILDICIRYRDSPALALVFDRLNGDIPRVTSHLLDPSVVGRPIFEQCAGSILMSGTLFPPNMYSDILGIPEEKSTCKEYESGFPPENRPILIASDVTSKFTERDASYSSIRDHIQSVLEKTKGNVAVFAPSYAMLDRICEDVYTFGKVDGIERRRMSKKEVERTIARLYEMRAMGRESVLFGVLSGKLSEGIDYSENILSAVVCVGLPLPPPSARQDALLEYYTRRFGRSKAWKYASLQPAVNSVLQALGRPIRNSEDKAIVVLLEKRFLERRVGDCMPKSMHTRQTTNPLRTSKHVERFFEMK